VSPKCSVRESRWYSEYLAARVSEWWVNIEYANGATEVAGPFDYEEDAAEAAWRIENPGAENRGAA
jgi:hypothetical protein